MLQDRYAVALTKVSESMSVKLAESVSPSIPIAIATAVGWPLLTIETT